MTFKTTAIFFALFWAICANAQTNLFLAYSDSTKKDIIIGQQTMQTKLYGKDTTAALKDVGEILVQLDKDSAALVAQFRANRSQYAQAQQIIAALKPGKPGAAPAETPDQKELRLLREELSRFKQQQGLLGEGQQPPPPVKTDKNPKNNKNR